MEKQAEALDLDIDEADADEIIDEDETEDPETDFYNFNPFALWNYDPSLEIYLKEVGRVPLLTREEEKNLTRQIKVVVDKIEPLEQRKEDGPPLSEEESKQLEELIEDFLPLRDKMARHNLRLVVVIAKKYAPSTNLPLLDLIQEGNIGLLLAVEKFDPGRGYRFSTYAYWWIQQAITRAIADKGNLIRLPVHIFERTRALARAQQEAQQKFTKDGKRMDIDALNQRLAGQIDISLTSLKQVQDAQALRKISSLNNPLPWDGIKELGDSICSEDILADDEASQEQMAERLAEALTELSDRERLVISLRFGLKDGISHTLEAVAPYLGGISRERVRQIQNEALDKLRHPRRRRRLEGLL